MIRALALLLLLALPGCAAAPRDAAPVDPLLFDPAAARQARAAVIGVPGALTSVRLMAPLDGFEAQGRTVAYYRLPGLDGRPRTGPLRIDAAADRIAAFAQEYDLDRVYLVGFSTGAAISLEAAKRIRTQRPQTQVAVAGISSALPAPQPILAGWRGLRGNLAAAWRTGSLNRREIWLEYYKTLLFGPQRRQSAGVRETAQNIADANAPRIVIPDASLARAHATALTTWTNPGKERLRGTAIALFHGADDPVFPLRAVERFARRLPERPLIVAYRDAGHLLVITQPDLYFDIAQFFGLNPRRR
ncbi:MAG: alpha/beta hydrolase [Pseudomonadota bacterium]